jgi:hypothetical protein
MLAFFVAIILAGLCLALVSALIAVIIYKVVPSLPKIMTIVISGLLPSLVLFFWLLRTRATVISQVQKDPQIWFHNNFGEGFLAFLLIGQSTALISAFFGLVSAYYILNRSSK